MLDIVITSLICGLLAFVIGWAVLEGMAYLLAWIFRKVSRLLWDGKTDDRGPRDGPRHDV